MPIGLVDADLVGVAVDRNPIILATSAHPVNAGTAGAKERLARTEGGHRFDVMRVWEKIEQDQADQLQPTLT